MVSPLVCPATCEVSKPRSVLPTRCLCRLLSVTVAGL